MSASTLTWTRWPTPPCNGSAGSIWIGNNAGVVCEQSPMWEQRTETWRWLIDVKLMGVVHGVRAFAPLLSRRVRVTSSTPRPRAG